MLRLVVAAATLLAPALASDLSESRSVGEEGGHLEFSRPIGQADESKNVLVEGEMFNVTITLYNRRYR